MYSKVYEVGVSMNYDSSRLEHRLGLCDYAAFRRHIVITLTAHSLCHAGGDDNDNENDNDIWVELNFVTLVK